MAKRKDRTPAPEAEIETPAAEPAAPAETEVERKPDLAANPLRAGLADIVKRRREQFAAENNIPEGTFADKPEEKEAPDRVDEITRLREKIAQGSGDEDDQAALAEMEAEDKAFAEKHAAPPAREGDGGAPEPAAEAEGEPEPAAEDEETYVRCIVRGKAYDVPKDEIDEAGGVAAWQKTKAADLYLEEAKAERAKAKIEAAGGGDPAAPPAEAKPDEKAEAAAARKERAAKLAKEILFGDEQTVAATIESLLEPQAPTGPAPLTAEQAVHVSRVDRERERSEAAFKAFAEDNADLKDKPILQEAIASVVRNEMVKDLERFGLTAQQAAAMPSQQIAFYHREARANGQARNIETIYSESATRVREELGQPAPGKPAARATNLAPAPKTLADRLDRKRSATSATPAGASARAPAPPSSQPKTRSAVVAGIAASRPHQKF